MTRNSTVFISVSPILEFDGVLPSDGAVFVGALQSHKLSELGFGVQSRDVRKRFSALFALRYKIMIVCHGRQLRQMSYGNDLPRACNIVELTSHNFGYSPADAGVYFVEYERIDVLEIGGNIL